jgi:hypothetical protein
VGETLAEKFKKPKYVPTGVTQSKTVGLEHGHGKRVPTLMHFGVPFQYSRAEDHQMTYQPTEIPNTVPPATFLNVRRWTTFHCFKVYHVIPKKPSFFFVCDEGPSHHSLKAFCATPMIMIDG